MAKAAALAETKEWCRNLPREEAIQHLALLTEDASRRKGATKLPPLAGPPTQAKAKPGDCPFTHPHYRAAFILTGHAD